MIELFISRLNRGLFCYNFGENGPWDVRRFRPFIYCADLYLHYIDVALQRKNEPIEMGRFAGQCCRMRIHCNRGGLQCGVTCPLGAFLIGIGAGFTYAMTAVIGRIAMQEESSPFAVATYNLFFGCLFIALVRHPWTTVDAPFNARLLLYGLLFGLIATALAYSIYFSGLSKITETGKVPVVALIELVVATIIGVFAFSESTTIIKIVGIVLVLLSILLFSWKTTPD